MNAITTRKSIQVLLGIPTAEQDGIIGPQTMAALRGLISADDSMAWPPESQPLGTLAVGDHKVMASSFADPADVAAFRRAKARGLSDQEAFKVGDNGVGYWSDDCTDESVPAVALPHDIWEAKYGPGQAARRKPVKVTCNGKTVTCFLLDTMPHTENIRNGAGLDMAPGAQKAFGLSPGFMVPAVWRWGDDETPPT